MRVLIENGSYHLMNMGDVAALQVALTRLRAIWPGVELHVPTREPERLARLCPGARAVEQGAPALGSVRERLYRRFPGVRRAAMAARRVLPPRSGADARAFGLVVACGGGYLADPFREHAMRVLGTLRAAVRDGRPAVMLGQGLGPIGDPTLWAAAREVLPRLDLLFVRDGRSGARLAEELGVDAERVVVTGDDTIETAHIATPASLGGGLGVNIRVADYSGVDRDDLPWVGAAIGNAARRLGAFVVPLPVSCHPTERDSVVIRLALGAGAQPLDAVGEAPSPQELIERTGRCRVVVTGSYHAGVFALAQGVSVVALAATRYYVEKFAGLEERFRAGCSVVSLREPGAAGRLLATITERWAAAERMRPRLLEAADGQVRAGWSAYRRLAIVAATDRVAP